MLLIELQLHLKCLNCYFVHYKVLINGNFLAVCAINSTVGFSYGVRSKCFRSMRKNEDPHKVQVSTRYNWVQYANAVTDINVQMISMFKRV